MAPNAFITAKRPANKTTESKRKSALRSINILFRIVRGSGRMLLEKCLDIIIISLRKSTAEYRPPLVPKVLANKTIPSSRQSNLQPYCVSPVSQVSQIQLH